jgi:hypothetical protein
MAGGKRTQNSGINSCWKEGRRRRNVERIYTKSKDQS